MRGGRIEKDLGRARSPEGGIGSSRSHRNLWAPQHMSWKPRSDPLPRQWVLWTAESSLQPRNPFPNVSEICWSAEPRAKLCWRLIVPERVQRSWGWGWMVQGQRSRLYSRASQLEQRRKLLYRDREWIDLISDGSALAGFYHNFIWQQKQPRSCSPITKILSPSPVWFPLRVQLCSVKQSECSHPHVHFYALAISSSFHGPLLIHADSHPSACRSGFSSSGKATVWSL